MQKWLCRLFLERMRQARVLAHILDRRIAVAAE